MWWRFLQDVDVPLYLCDCFWLMAVPKEGKNICHLENFFFCCRCDFHHSLLLPQSQTENHYLLDFNLFSCLPVSFADCGFFNYENSCKFQACGIARKSFIQYFSFADAVFYLYVRIRAKNYPIAYFSTVSSYWNLRDFWTFVLFYRAKNHEMGFKNVGK